MSVTFRRLGPTRSSRWQRLPGLVRTEHGQRHRPEAPEGALHHRWHETDPSGEARMVDDITWNMDTCTASVNSHLQWFGRLLGNHFEGIITHATHRIPSDRMEGINNKIKVLRWQAYGLPDDDYFFLRLFDASRKNYVRNPLSHKICD